MNGSALLIGFALALAQVPALWTAQQAGSSCDPLADFDVHMRTCRPLEFGPVPGAAAEGLRYALYNHLPETMSEAFRDPEVANVVAVFGPADSTGTLLSLVHVRVGRINLFQPPRLLTTTRGRLLHFAAGGLGDGRSQHNYHEYWEFRGSGLVQLEVWDWISSVNSELPEGFGLDGVNPMVLDLESMTYSGNVRRIGDCHNCATGGTVRVRFRWDGLTLRAAEVDHDPDGD